MTLTTMTYEVTGRIARITLNRPERGNGITLELPRELAACVERANLEQYAQQIGLDMTKFRQALDRNEHRGAIEADQQLAQSVGANGTPNFFINGRQLVGAQPFEAFKTIIDEEIANAERDALAEADRIAERLRGEGVVLEGAAARSEAIAVIAYLQSLGRAWKDAQAAAPPGASASAGGR